MRVEQLGEGTPEVAIVGAVHGDEPSGARTIERLLAEEPPVARPVKLIVANEEALRRGVRYVDADLNRAFDREGAGHEHRLAHDLARELEGCTALSLHATQSHPEPFAFVADLRGAGSYICPRLPIVAVVILEDFEGRPFALSPTELIEVECGLQGSERAAENAHEVARAFLAATGALPDEREPADLPVYRLGPPIEKPAADSYEVFAENFARVEAGQPFAAADGEELTAEEAFFPILLSPYGYEDQFGYVGERVGTLEAEGRRSFPDVADPETDGDR